MGDLTKDFIAYAVEQVGEPYLYGAKGPNAWDCSGLVEKAGRHVNVSLPAGAAQQFYSPLTREISVEAALHCPGCLLYIQNRLAYPTKRGGIGHVAISLGDGRRVVEARGKRWGVVISNAFDAKGRCRFNRASKIDKLYP